jgi:hypothetical protein
MRFIKNVTIYENTAAKTKIYINECHRCGRKTRVFAVRKDDKTGLAEYLGSIKFNPRWRQYVFNPEKDTFWSSGCMKNIMIFIDKMNLSWRKKIKEAISKKKQKRKYSYRFRARPGYSPEEVKTNPNINNSYCEVRDGSQIIDLLPMSDRHARREELQPAPETFLAEEMRTPEGLIPIERVVPDFNLLTRHTRNEKN